MVPKGTGVATAECDPGSDWTAMKRDQIEISHRHQCGYILRHNHCCCLSEHGKGGLCEACGKIWTMFALCSFLVEIFWPNVFTFFSNVAIAAIICKKTQYMFDVRGHVKGRGKEGARRTSRSSSEEVIIVVSFNIFHLCGMVSKDTGAFHHQSANEFCRTGIFNSHHEFHLYWYDKIEGTHQIIVDVAF